MAPFLANEKKVNKYCRERHNAPKHACKDREVQSHDFVGFLLPCLQRHSLFPGFFKKPPTPESQQWIRAIIARPSLQTAANCSVRTWSLLNITKYYKMDWFITLELSGTDKKKRNVEIILLLRIMTNMSKDARRKEPIGKTYT